MINLSQAKSLLDTNCFSIEPDNISEFIKKLHELTNSI